MSWEDLLGENDRWVLPWYGGMAVHNAKRSWLIDGPKPQEHGWYEFNTTGGRCCTLAGPDKTDPDPAWAEGQETIRGYMVGDRLITDWCRIDPAPNKLVEQTEVVYCVEPGLTRFTRAAVVRDRVGYLVYVQQEFPQGPEIEVLAAYQDREPNVNHIPGVTPSLDLAFRWVSRQRELAEARRQELEKIWAEEEKEREKQERIKEEMERAGTAVHRRSLAGRDFDVAAREALRVSGAEILDTRPGFNEREMVVQYRFRQRRFECVVDKMTLRIIDAGVCLTDERTGEKGDTRFTLESLPGVVGEAIDQDVLVVFRHVR